MRYRLTGPEAKHGIRLSGDKDCIVYKDEILILQRLSPEDFKITHKKSGTQSIISTRALKRHEDDGLLTRIRELNHFDIT